jgi:predicted transcriptional regulator
MVKTEKLTPAEWEIMECIWELKGAPSVRDVLEFAFSNGEKAYTTVRTIMNTLVKKGLLKREKIGLVNFYSPVISRSQIVKTEMSSVVSRVFNGSVPAFANFLINFEELTLKEIKEIKLILDKKENELRSKKL